MKEGTIGHFFTKPNNFEGKTDGKYGGGMSQEGMVGGRKGSGMLEQCMTAMNDSRPKENTKSKAQARSKRKRGANSKTGRGLGSQGKGSDSSQSLIRNYFNCKERPVEVGNSLGSSKTDSNTS